MVVEMGPSDKTGMTFASVVLLFMWLALVPQVFCPEGSEAPLRTGGILQRCSYPSNPPSFCRCSSWVLRQFLWQRLSAKWGLHGVDSSDRGTWQRNSCFPPSRREESKGIESSTLAVLYSSVIGVQWQDTDIGTQGKKIRSPSIACMSWGIFLHA